MGRPQVLSPSLRCSFDMHHTPLTQRPQGGYRYGHQVDLYIARVAQQECALRCNRNPRRSGTGVAVSFVILNRWMALVALQCRLLSKVSSAWTRQAPDTNFTPEVDADMHGAVTLIFDKFDKSYF